MASVDVAVPCYQYGALLRDCVTSILTQRDVDSLRVLIIDNASTDNSLEVAHQLAAEDRRVNVVAHAINLGQHASFNEGIDWASSDYFMLLCADDLLAPGALARAVSVMEHHPHVNLAYGRALFVTQQESLPALEQASLQGDWRVFSGRDLLRRFCGSGRCHIPGPTAVVRTSAQKQAGHYRPELPHTDDFEMWMRLACLGDIAETDAVQGVARIHAANRCSTVRDVHLWDLNFEAAFESFFAKEGASLPEAGQLHRMARRTLGDRAYWSAMASFVRGDGRLGWSLLKYAFARRPASTVLPPVGYLFKRADALDRIRGALSDAAISMRAWFREGPRQPKVSRHSR